MGFPAGSFFFLRREADAHFHDPGSQHEQWKKGPRGCVGYRGWLPTHLCGNFFIDHEISGSRNLKQSVWILSEGFFERGEPRYWYILKQWHKRFAWRIIPGLVRDLSSNPILQQVWNFWNLNRPWSFEAIWSDWGIGKIPQESGSYEFYIWL